MRTTFFSAAVLILTIVSVAPVLGQWGSDARLTNDAGTSQFDEDGTWEQATSDDTVHVVWADTRAGNCEIYYKRSTDNGATWGSDLRLTNNTGWSHCPSVAVSGRVVHVVWDDNKDGNVEVYYLRSSDNGSTWGSEVRLTNNAAESHRASVAVSGSTVHVCWDDTRDATPPEIYYKRSVDGGITWSGDIRLTFDAGWSHCPAVAASGSIVRVVWDDDTLLNGNVEIYYRSSTDNGSSWGDKVRLTNDNAQSHRASVAVSDSTVHVVWEDTRAGNCEIYYKRSTDGGNTWGSDTRLTYNAGWSHCPLVAVFHSLVHVVWDDDDPGNAEVYYKSSTDDGSTWASDVRLTNNAAQSHRASVGVSDSAVNVCWDDNRDGNYEIYCKRNPTGNRYHDVGVARLLAPTGQTDSGSSLTPACSVYNYGNVALSYSVRMRIGGYNQTASVTSHAPGTAQYVTFPSWTATQRGTNAVSCSTELSTDMDASNDKQTGSVTVQVHDVGATHVTSPVGPVDSGTSVTPACTVYNYGTTTPASYSVRMKIGASYSQAVAVTNHAPSTAVYVTFPTWTAMTRGSNAVVCSTELAGDLKPANDKLSGAVSVRVIDAEAISIITPDGAVDSGSTVVPQVDVRNNGTQAATFSVRLTIGTGYTNTQTVTSLGAGATDTVSFAAWTANNRGSFATSCSTQLAADMVPANDKVTGLVTVSAHDLAVLAITRPAGMEVPGSAVTPSATVRNYGTSREACKVFFRIDCTPPYSDSVSLTAGLPHAETTLAFTNWTAIVGSYTARCSAYLATDQVWDNNMQELDFRVGNPGWTEKKSMPAGAKAIKDGGWLAYDASRVRTFASRGNKQPDFFAYAPLGDSWSARAPWLPGTEGKLPGKGSAGCADGSGHIYATKGNNTRGFFTYDANANTWTQKKDVPLGLSNKKVKGGTDIVWALKGGVGSPYLLKGYKNEFYKYVVAGDSWLTLPPAPGAIPKWDKGSWLAYDGAHTIYAHKAKYHEFYKYDTEKDSWNAVALTAMPMPGSAGSKKSKDGGCGTYLDATIYALKGGNTQEFWKYTVSSNSWVERETIPRGTFKKRVKAGGDIVTAGKDLYAIKGNKSNELWKYTTGIVSEPPPPTREGVAAERVAIGEWRIAVSPNPLAGGFVCLIVGGTSLSRPALVRLYDAAGRCVGVWKPLLRNGAADLDVRHLAAGVYLVKVETDGFAATQKLVVQR